MLVARKNCFNTQNDGTPVKAGILEKRCQVALRARQGVCQDLAHIMIALVRELRIPGRYVSGYLWHGEDNEDRSSAGATHAWMEAFLPGAGWVGLDATNGIFCNHNFISTAVGLTPSDITPISGSYFHKEEIPSRMTSQLELLNL